MSLRQRNPRWRRLPAVSAFGIGEAFAWLDRAFEERAPWLTYIKTDPAFDGLHSDRRFRELLKRIGLPQ